MPTKTDRILKLLPGTFRIDPRPEVLYALIDTFGRELLSAENTLAAVMAAHWVDYADRGSEAIDDLAKIAALYGLAPRREADLSGFPRNLDDDPGEVLETVEEFREHLKRYIRTFLDGTVTVQGILRVTAEALALRIKDEYDDMDCWWNRQPQNLITLEPRRDNAAQKVFGVKTATVVGQTAHPAQVKGTVDLSNGVDLRDANLLRLQVDAQAPVEIDLVAGADPKSVPLQTIVETINRVLGGRAVAHNADGYLTLTSPTTGASSRLEVQEGLHDAAERILGLAPWVYQGSETKAAQVMGSVALSSSLDLSQRRYLRLEIDRTRLAEIDCAGANPAQTTPQQVCDAINRALGIPNLATLREGRYLTLTSPTTGFNSSIAFHLPAAQDATSYLFGSVNSFYIGQDIQPAKLKGKRDLSQGVDLRDRANIRFRLDEDTTLTVNCAGANPRNTQITEIVTAINNAVGAEVATQDGRFVTLTGRRVGARGRIVLEPAPTGDATEEIFGIRSRIFQGNDATAAQIASEPNLTQGLDEGQKGVFIGAILIAVDSGSPVEIGFNINLKIEGENPETARSRHLDELVNAINQALPNIASRQGKRLILTSPTIGSISRLDILPLETEHQRQFVTRAMVTDEATPAIFGFLTQEAQGKAATSAQIVGTVDLSRSVNLQNQRYLRIGFDGKTPIDINCAGQRPRVTTVDEVVQVINTRLGKEVASHDGQHLILTSLTDGSDSRITIEPPQVEDALSVVLGVKPGTFKGQDATQVKFVGTVDLSQGITLSPNAAIKLEVDGFGVKEIPLTGAESSLQPLDRLMMTINGAIGQVVAKTDGKHLILTSLSTGTASKIRFDVPTGADVTAALFGITPPRLYQGTDALSAQVTGTVNFSTNADLRTARFLRLQLGTSAAVDIDCAAGVSSEHLNAVKLSEIVSAINAKVPGVASASSDRNYLILRSPNSGSTAELTLEPYTSGDASKLLLDKAPTMAQGQAATPAIITGEIDLTKPVNLGQRSLLRLSVDSDRAIDIDVAGFDPAATFSDEILAAINAAVPGLASLTASDRLQLTSPTTGAGSRLSLQPLRYLELMEYLPQLNETLGCAMRHGDRCWIDNSGVAETVAKVKILAPQGTVGPTLVNETLGWQVRLFAILDAEETVELQCDAKAGLKAAIASAKGTTRSVSASDILVGPIGRQVWVPFEGDYQLRHDAHNQESLQLNNPLSSKIVRLRALQSDSATCGIAVSVRESLPPTIAPEIITGDRNSEPFKGRVRIQNARVQLVDATERAILELRAAPGIDLTAYQDRVVILSGTLYTDDTARTLIVQQIDPLFDVSLHRSSHKSESEQYQQVTIGAESSAPHSIIYQLCTKSQVVIAEELDKGSVLTLPRGQSEWIYLDCYSSRFNQSNFDEACFPGKTCYERGVFDVSRFTHHRHRSNCSDVPPKLLEAVFTASTTQLDPPVSVSFAWSNNRPGSFVVNLPADLPTRFGGRFNEARFSQEKDKPELYSDAVTEKTGDESFDRIHYLVTLINEKSNLVKAESVSTVPLGGKIVEIPFRKPQRLTLGKKDKFAQIYLSEKGVSGYIKLQARTAGAWGNDITVSARPSGSGPAMYDIAIAYTASRFENARQVALGSPQPALMQDILKPTPIGVLQAKAAGVRVDVTRDTCI
ncbi:MAG TPA: hypothetical protein V6C85_17790 [Allocoleopsis sp.]